MALCLNLNVVSFFFLVFSLDVTTNEISWPLLSPHGSDVTQRKEAKLGERLVGEGRKTRQVRTAKVTAESGKHAQFVGVADQET